MWAMKPKDLRLDKLRLPTLVQPKIDGMRAKFERGVWTSADDNEIVGMQYYHSLLAPLEAVGLQVDVELECQGKDFEEGCGYIRSHADYKLDLIVNIIDIPNVKNVNTRERLRWIGKFFNTTIRHPDIRPIPFFDVDTLEGLDYYYKKFRSEGYEGWVCKDPNSLYTPGKTWDWMRRVPVKSVDCKVVGWIPGKGKYEGACGSLVVLDPHGQRFNVGGGLDDSERFEIASDFGSYNGRSVRVLYQRRTNTGSYRHPRVDRWRVDQD